jgi:hypothetical protein
MSFLDKIFKKKDPLLDSSSASAIPPLDPPMDFTPPAESSLMADKMSESKFPKPPMFDDEVKSFKQNKAHESASSDQDLKLISAKLDTVLAKMDSINQRIANLERIASDSQ